MRSSRDNLGSRVGESEGSKGTSPDNVGSRVGELEGSKGLPKGWGNGTDGGLDSGGEGGGVWFGGGGRVRGAPFIMLVRLEYREENAALFLNI